MLKEIIYDCNGHHLLLVIGTIIITGVEISVTYCMVKIKEQTQQK